MTIFSQSIFSQNHLNYLDSLSLFKNNNNKTVTARSVERSKLASILPSPQIKRNKIKSEKFDSETVVTLYMEEYKNNKIIESDDNTLERITYSSNDYLSAEIIADTSNYNKLTIYTMLSGSIGLKYRNITKDHKLKSIPFSHKVLKNGKNIPIILLYEDNINNNMESALSKYTKNDSLPVQFNHSQKPFSEISRYIVIFYTTTKE